MGIKRTKEEWAALVKEYKRSGQSLLAWSDAHGINAKTMGGHTKSNRSLGKHAQDSGRHQGKRTKAEWDALIAEYQLSGLSQARWCRENGINDYAMRSAQRRIAAQSSCAHPKIPSEHIEFIRVRPEATSIVGTGVGIGHIKITTGDMTIEADGKYPFDALSMLTVKLCGLC